MRSPPAIGSAGGSGRRQGGAAYNLFTLTLALAAMPAVFLAWQLPRWLRL